MTDVTGLAPLPLPDGITSRHVATDTGLLQHILEAGEADRPLLLLMHGFPELAFSWRHVMVPLAEAGFYVVAPDHRGYGRTTGWTADYDDDLRPWGMPNLVRDVVALVRALGREATHATIGHDFGAPLTAWTALLRPDIAPRIVTMSSPFGGAPRIAPRSDTVHDDLLTLHRPRKHYQRYYSTRPANADMMTAPEGLHAFLRAYFHMKSGDWAGNAPFELDGWNADALAQMPTYYVMDADATMPESVAEHHPSAEEIAACRWMPEGDMAVFAAEYGRTGFQGGLQSYRCGTSQSFRRDLSVFDGVPIRVPTMFIAGRSDWGWAQFPGALAALERTATTDFRGTRFVDGAGHWVQQEMPEAVVSEVLSFLAATASL